MSKQFEYINFFRKTDKGMPIAALSEITVYKNGLTGETREERPGHAYLRTRNLSSIEGLVDKEACRVFRLSELTVKENLNLVHSQPPTRSELVSLVRAAYIGCSDPTFPQSASRGLTETQLESLCSKLGIEGTLELGEAILVNSYPDPEEIAPFASRLG